MMIELLDIYWLLCAHTHPHTPTHTRLQPPRSHTHAHTHTHTHSLTQSFTHTHSPPPHPTGSELPAEEPRAAILRAHAEASGERGLPHAADGAGRGASTRGAEEHGRAAARD